MKKKVFRELYNTEVKEEKAEEKVVEKKEKKIVFTKKKESK